MKLVFAALLKSPNLPRPFLMLLRLVQLIGALVDVQGRLLGMELDPLDRLALLHHQGLNAHEQSVHLLDGLLQAAQLIEPIHQIAQRLSFLLRLLQELRKWEIQNMPVSALVFSTVSSFQNGNGTILKNKMSSEVHILKDI